MVILENIDIDIDKAILQNIDIDKISNRFKFGISNRAIPDSMESQRFTIKAEICYYCPRAKFLQAECPQACSRCPVPSLLARVKQTTIFSAAALCRMHNLTLL